MKDWVYYLPVFEVDTYDPQVRTSEWSGHTNFAYDLVRFIKPEKIVELGTHFGTSFFSFCQSVKDGNLFTKCFAIDTWQSDLHSGFYNDDVLLRVYIDKMKKSHPFCVILGKDHYIQIHYSMLVLYLYC
ncbi:conserved domain protein [Bacillus sp. GeD10]|nr:conserved domain protein [Bacillus sp. GeD10]